MNSVITIIYTLAIIWQAVLAEVDDGTPDYSKFRDRLRKVDKAKKPLTSDQLAARKAQAAIHIGQELAHAQPDIKCPALSHTFKALDEAVSEQPELNKKVLEGIAQVVSTSEESRTPLLEDDGNSFITAFESLESMEPTKDVESALFILIECLTLYYTDKVNGFLRNQKRAPLIERFLKNLDESQPQTSGPKPDKQADLIGHEKVVTNRIEEKAKPTELPKEQERVISESRPQVEFDSAQLTLMRMIKMRMESPQVSPYDVKLPVNYRLATDFLKFWANLNKAQLNPYDSFDRKAIEFRDDGQNAALAAELERLVKIYSELSSLVMELESDLRERRFKQSSSKQMAFLIKEIENLLTEIGDFFDVRILKRKFNACQQAYTQHKTMEKFIRSDFGRK